MMMLKLMAMILTTNKPTIRLSKGNAVTEGVDLVYTWVSNKSKKYNDIRKSYTDIKTEHFVSGDIFSEISALSNYTFSDTNDSCNRMSSLDEIVHSIKSVKKNAPWINNIYVVLPELHFEYFPVKNLTEMRINLVAQEDLLGGFNPSFNSNAIELCLDEIPNLSDRFIYMNDDVMINKPIELEDLCVDDKILVTYQKFWGLCVSPYLASVVMGILSIKKEKSTMARYTSSLLFDDHGLLVSHAPIIIDKHVYRDIKDKFKKEVITTMNNKFRHETDMVMPHYIYPHYMKNLNRTFENDEMKIKEVKWVDDKFLNENTVKQLTENDDYTFLLLNDERSNCETNEANDKILTDFLIQFNDLNY